MRAYSPAIPWPLCSPSGRRASTTRSSASHTPGGNWRAPVVGALLHQKQWRSNMSNEVDSVGELLDKVVEIEKNRTKKHHPDAPRAEVVRKGVKMIVPETMGLLDAAKVLVNQAIYEDKEVSVREIFDYPIPDGALAFRHALEERYGVIAFEDYEKQGMFGPVKVKAQSMTVRIGPNQTTQVPWGQVEVPALGGFLVSDSAVRGGRPPFIFSVTGTIKRRYEGEFQALCHDIRLRLAEPSIYPGQAIPVRFTDQDH